MHLSTRRLITLVLMLTVSTVLLDAPGLRQAQAADESVPYKLLGANAGTGRFYIIEPESGAGTELFVAPGRRIEGLAYDSVNKILYGIDNGINCILVKIDLTNQTVTDIGVIDGYNEITAFTYDETTGNLYALDQTTYTLLLIDPATAARTAIGRFFYGAANALAAQPGTGNLYAIVGVDPSRLATINKTTAALSLIGSTGFVTAPALDFHPSTGVLYTTVNGSSLATVDITTGQVTIIQPSSISGQITAIEFIPDPASTSQNQPPTAYAGGTYAVNEGGSVVVTAIGSDPENGPLTYAWDLDNNGTFETPGQNVSFSAVGLNAPSSHTITVRVTDDGGLVAIDSATVNVLNIASLRIVTESPLPAGIIGVPYFVTLEAEGGTQPYTWSIIGGALPPGLNLNGTTGVISGTPTTAGTFGFTIQVQDSSQLVVSKSFTLAPPPPFGNAGSNYDLPLYIPDVPSNSPPPSSGQLPLCSNYRLVSGTLPDGVTLDPVTGIISGIPLNGGTYNFTVECVDIANQTVSKDFTITIYNPVPTIIQLIPSWVREDTGDFTLRVIGTNFVKSSVIQWNGSRRTTTFVSATELEAAITNSDIVVPGSTSVTVVNPEPSGGTSNAVTFTILPNNPPTIDLGGLYHVDEGSSVEVVASGGDPDGDSITLRWDLDNDGTFEIHGSTTTFSAAVLDGPSSYTVTAKATDSFGLSATDQTMIVVKNVSPTVGLITASMEPIAANTTIDASALFTDPGILDSHVAVWDWGDTNTTVGVVNKANGSGSVSGSHVYTTPGIYTIKLAVTDKDGASGYSQTQQYVVIYDPGGGFVTGGGWINSPTGAYAPEPSLTGKANFGFVSKYQKGSTVPTGQTEFQFQVSTLNFHSSSYDWLVIAGAKAQYKGSGTINGGGDYGFMLTATDGHLSGGGGVDKFRIKIWHKGTDNIVYDNQMGTTDTANPTTLLGGGSIVLHK